MGFMLSRESAARRKAFTFMYKMLVVVGVLTPARMFLVSGGIKVEILYTKLIVCKRVVLKMCSGFLVVVVSRDKNLMREFY